MTELASREAVFGALRALADRHADGFVVTSDAAGLYSLNAASPI